MSKSLSQTLASQLIVLKDYIRFLLPQVSTKDQDKEKSKSKEGKLVRLLLAKGRCWTGTWQRALKTTGFLLVKDRRFEKHHFIKLKLFQRLSFYRLLSSLLRWLTQLSLPASTTMTAKIFLCLFCLKSYCAVLLSWKM